MTRLLATTAVLALLAAAPAWAQATRPTTNGTADTAASAQAIDQQDADFAKEAAIGGRYEVDLGKTAQSKGQNQAVKDFGKHMADDHGKANDKLTAVAKDLKLTLPSALDQKHKDTVDRLSKLSGDQFDRDLRRAVCIQQSIGFLKRIGELRIAPATEQGGFVHHLHQCEKALVELLFTVRDQITPHGSGRDGRSDRDR